jgi:hypothetical protein
MIRYIFWTTALALGTASTAIAEDTQKLGIADVIEAVRAELIEAQERREGKGLPALFITKQFELELTFGVKKSADGSGKVSFWVVELGGGGAYETSELQRIKLTFETPKASPPSQQAVYISPGDQIPPVVPNLGSVPPTIPGLQPGYEPPPTFRWKDYLGSNGGNTPWPQIVTEEPKPVVPQIPGQFPGDMTPLPLQ